MRYGRMFLSAVVDTQMCCEVHAGVAELVNNAAVRYMPSSCAYCHMMHFTQLLHTAANSDAGPCACKHYGKGSALATAS